jgi:hypothetical protein
MNGKVRRVIEMGERVLIFANDHADNSTGSIRSTARLERLLRRAAQLFIQQERGKSQEHAAAGHKLEIQRLLKLADLSHVLAAAQSASVEEPELWLKFVLDRSSRSFQHFGSAARIILTHATNHRELLERHGMARPVFEHLRDSLEDFERATQEVYAGRLAHVGATAELQQIAKQVLLIVKLMNGHNQIRFRNQPEALAAWDLARKVWGHGGRAETAAA